MDRARRGDLLPARPLALGDRQRDAARVGRLQRAALPRSHRSAARARRPRNRRHDRAGAPGARDVGHGRRGLPLGPAPAGRRLGAGRSRARRRDPRFLLHRPADDAAPAVPAHDAHPVGSRGDAGAPDAPAPGRRAGCARAHGPRPRPVPGSRADGVPRRRAPVRLHPQPRACPPRRRPARDPGGRGSRRVDRGGRLGQLERAARGLRSGRRRLRARRGAGGHHLARRRSVRRRRRDPARRTRADARSSVRSGASATLPRSPWSRRRARGRCA